MPLMKLRFATPSVIIDINAISGLDYLKEEGGMLKIGALVRESALESSPIIAKKFPILADAAKVIADPLVRNRATIVGNLAHGDPANDHPAVMLALGAELVAAAGGGERVISINDFFLDTLTTSLKEGEILKEVRVPVPPAKSGGAYLKIERKVGDFAIVAVAAQITLDDKGKIKSAGIGLTNVGNVPIKATAAEAALVGKTPDEAAFAEAGKKAAEASRPASDNRAPAEYKKSMVREYTIRALRLAVERAKGGK